MTTIDWKKGPGFKPIDMITLPHYTTTVLNNGVKLIEVRQGTQDIIKLDIVYRGGRFLEHKKLVAKFTAILLREGTQSYSSAEIANTLDFYGAVLRVSNNLDHIYLSLTCLTKYFDDIMPIIQEIVFQPTFPESELAKIKKTSIERLALDLSKNDVLSYRLFTEALYGKDEAYGYNTEIEAIEKITRHDLINYYQSAFGSDNCYIVLGGQYSSVQSQIVVETFGSVLKKSKPYTYQSNTTTISPTTITHPTKNELQSSVKVGRRMFGRHHKDFGKFFVLNTILGGYFGSRLMSSIREDLGYTYNIYSALDFMIHDGYFYISTEVGREYLNDTLHEIKNNIEVIQTEKIRKPELDMVKSYLKGNMLNLIDGPLNTANTIRSLELDFSLGTPFDHFLDDIEHVTAKDLQVLAQQYLNWEEMTLVIVG